jgi:hypothetical protein
LQACTFFDLSRCFVASPSEEDGRRNGRRGFVGIELRRAARFSSVNPIDKAHEGHTKQYSPDASKSYKCEGTRRRETWHINPPRSVLRTRRSQRAPSLPVSSTSNSEIVVASRNDGALQDVMSETPKESKMMPLAAIMRSPTSILPDSTAGPFSASAATWLLPNSKRIPKEFACASFVPFRFDVSSGAQR